MRCGEVKTLIRCWWNVGWGSHCGTWLAVPKASDTVTGNSSPFPHRHPRGMKTNPRTSLHASVHSSITRNSQIAGAIPVRIEGTVGDDSAGFNTVECCPAAERAAGQSEGTGRKCAFAQVEGPESWGVGRGFQDGGREHLPRLWVSLWSEVAVRKATVGTGARTCQRAETRRTLRE